MNSAGTRSGQSVTNADLIGSTAPRRDRYRRPAPGWPRRARHHDPMADHERATELNVLGTELVPCGTDPMTGFHRDGCCSSAAEDVGSHTICAVVTAEFLAHQQ